MNLHDAAKEGNLNALRQLIHEGADPNAIDEVGWAPLHWAVEFGHTEIALALIENGCDIDITTSNINITNRITNYTALHIAIVTNNTQIASALIRAGATVDAIAEVSDIIYEMGLDINHRNPDLYTPLQASIIIGHHNCTKLLINHSANVNATDQYGNTPLHWVAELGHTEIVLALIQAGANVHAANRRGNTPLNWAIYEKKLATALAIIHYGKVPYTDIPVIENNPTSEYIQRQYQLATNQDSVSSYARGLFTGMNPSPRSTIMAKIKIFVKGTEAKGAYPLTMKLLYNGRGLPSDLINVILEHAGLLPKDMDLNKLMVYPCRSDGLFPAEATTSTSSHSSATPLSGDKRAL